MKNSEKVAEEYETTSQSDEDVTEYDVEIVERETCGGGEIVALAESCSLSSAFEASRSEKVDLRGWAERCYGKPGLGPALSSAQCLFVRDVESQIFLVRKVSTLLPARCPPLRIWFALLRSVGTVGCTLCFLFSGAWPVRGLRFVLGSVCRSATHACILSEALGCVRDTLSSLRTSPQSEHNRVLEQNAARFTAALSGFVITSALPAPVLATHFVGCLSSALVDATINLVRDQGDSILCGMREHISRLYTKVRLSQLVRPRLHIYETSCEELEDWTISDIRTTLPE